MATPTVKLTIELKRVQTFIFEVPRLKAMLGANALIGQTMRHELPALLGARGSQLPWPTEIRLQGTADDPLDRPETAPADRDDPAALYRRGILARDGGHFSVLFDDRTAAERFLEDAETVLAERLPGVLYEARIDDFPEPQEPQRRSRKPNETALLDLPVLQVCEETGRGPASDQEPYDGETRWQARSVEHRRDFGHKFYTGKTRDIIGLLRNELYPDCWKRPNDLADLVAGGYLALIHADGNGIGKRYKSWRDQAKSTVEVVKEAHGEAFFHSMRVAVRRAVVDALEKTFDQEGAKENPCRPYEILMLGGDDLLLACRADRALDFARNYSEELTRYTLADGQPLTVAIGVAIAQKTYPLHRLHELAEDLASSAKRLHRALDEKNDKTSVIDWQVVTQSWFAGVAEARRQAERIQYQVNGQTETLLLTERPYRLLGEGGFEDLLKKAEALDAPRAPDAPDGENDDDQTARSPLRALRTACEQGRLMAEMAFGRLPLKSRASLGWDKDRLWKEVAGARDESIHLTRALDIVGIREIGRLGKKRHD